MVSRKLSRLSSTVLSQHREQLAGVARQHGSAYVYDLDAARDRIIDLKQRLNGVSIYYAMKANPLRELIKLYAEFADGIEVASFGELEYAIACGAPADKIVFASPAKTEREVCRSIELGIRALHIETVDEFRTAHLVRQACYSGTLLVLRVNTDVGVQAPLEQMAGGASRFGIDEAVVFAPASRNLVQFSDGIHVYAGSQLREASIVIGQFERTLRVAQRVARIKRQRLKYINFGGGFGVPHQGDDLELDVGSIACWFTERQPSAREIAIELGRYLVSEIGVFVTTIRSVKRSHERIFASTDCGFNGFLRPAFTGDHHEVVLIAGGEEGPDDVAVSGPLCTPLDSFGVIRGCEVRTGDVVAVLNAGAYGWSMSPHFFLGHHTPAEVVIDAGRPVVVRNRVNPLHYFDLGR